MTDRTWVGGGNNRASNKNDWSPTGAPQPGDTLTMPNGGTMNIRDDDLAGNTLVIGVTEAAPVSATLNLSHHAQATVSSAGETGTDITINVAGKDTLNYSASIGTHGVTVNLADHATLTGSISFVFGDLTINGSDGATFIHDGTDTLAGVHAIIMPNILGTGSLTVGSAQSVAGFLEVGGRVSGGQNITISGDPGREATGILQIDHPREFQAPVTMQGTAEIDLEGLAKADSYTYSNDLLTIYSSNRVIDRLTVTNESTANSLVVSKNGNDVWVTQDGLNAPPSGSSPLPQHTETASSCCVLPHGG